MCKCKLDICVTENVNYAPSTYLHRNSIAHLVSDYTHVLYISTYIRVGEIPSCYVPPPSCHYPFHTRLSLLPSLRTWPKVSSGKLARKLACPRFRKTAPFGKIHMFRIRYREIMAHKEAP